MSLRRRRTIGPSFPYLSTPYGGVAAGGYDADTTAWISAVVGAGGTVSDAQKDRVDDLIVGLKAASLWTKCDALWLWAGEAVSAQATKDIRGLRTLTIPVGTDTLTWRGFHSPSGDAVINTGIVLTTGGLQYSLNSGSVGVYVAARAAGIGSDGAYLNGVNDGTNFMETRLYFSAAQVFRTTINDATFHDLAVISTVFKDGFFLASRTSSSTRAGYRDGVQLGSSITETSVGVPGTWPLVFSGRNDNGTYTPLDQDDYCVGWVGAGLNSTEAANLSSLILAYLANYNVVPAYNMLVATQELTSGSWSLGGNLLRSADAAVAPDGTTTADKVWVNTATSGERLSQAPSFTEAGTNTLSFYIKTAGITWAYIRCLGADDIIAWFNVAAGTPGSVTGAGGSRAMSADLGGGWYRCSVTTPSTAGICMVGPADGDTNNTQTPSGTNGLYVWGAQLTAGSSPLVYNRIP